MLDRIASADLRDLPHDIVPATLLANDCREGRRAATTGVASVAQVAFDPDAGIVLQQTAVQTTAINGGDPLAVLIVRMQARDQAALSALHVICAPRLFAAALRIVRRPEVAHEAVSAALMQAWINAHAFDPLRGSVLTWLGTIVHSRALDILRRDQRRSKIEIEQEEHDVGAIDEATPGPCKRVEQAEIRVRLRRAMTLLTPIQRQIISLTFLEGRSHEEAATHVGMPLGTVKSHVRRGLAMLRGYSALRAACA